MYVFKQIQEQLQKSNPKQLINKLGYNNHLLAKKRLGIFINCKTLYDWLESNIFDFKYSNLELLQKLCNIFEFDKNLLEIELISYNKYKLALYNQFDSVVFIDTEFKRSSEPIYALAALEPMRYINIDKWSLVNKSFIEQFEIVKALICKHAKSYGKELSIWGDVKRYVWEYTESKSVAFFPDGSVESINSPGNLSRSRFFLRC